LGAEQDSDTVHGFSSTERGIFSGKPGWPSFRLNLARTGHPHPDSWPPVLGWAGRPGSSGACRCSRCRWVGGRSSLCPPARSFSARRPVPVWPGLLSALKFFSRRNQHSRKQSSPSPSHLPSTQLQSPIAIDSFFDREDLTYLCNHVPQRPQTVDAGGQRPLCLWQSRLGRWPVSPPLLASFSLVPISCRLVHRSAPALRLGAPARIARSWFSISSTASIDFWECFYLGRVLAG